MRRALFAVVLLLFACDGGKPDRLDGPVSESDSQDEVSDRLCYAYEECNCGELAGVSLNGCETGLGFAWQGVTEDARMEGLTYDGDCLSKRLNVMLDRGCETIEPGNSLFCGEENCLIYHGDKKEGEECEGGVSQANCEQGLVCLGTCQKPCQNTGFDIPEGDLCFDSEIPFSGLCAEGLICDRESGLCASTPGEGETCVQGQCGEGLRCASMGTELQCIVPKATGEACTTATECASAVCTPGDQTCGDFPAVGEMCVGYCADGATCAIAADAQQLTCQTIPAKGEPCLTQTLEACADGLVCLNDTCSDPPGEGKSCVSTNGLPVQCAGDLICGAKLCSLDSSVEGCDECDAGDESCVVQVCVQNPPAVCGDSGGLLF